MSDGDAVRVAVRVRPFNSREKARNAVNIIEMTSKQTMIRDPSNDSVKTFNFDHSYWSHDQFEEDENGCRLSQTHVPFNDMQICGPLPRSMLIR
jgi:kinesin family protein 1